MSIKDCIKQLKTLDPADAAVFEAHRKTLTEAGVPGKDAYTQAAELTMESILEERNALSKEIVTEGGAVDELTIENLLNPASYQDPRNPVEIGLAIWAKTPAGKASVAKSDKEAQARWAREARNRTDNPIKGAMSEFVDTSQEEVSRFDFKPLDETNEQFQKLTEQGKQEVRDIKTEMAEVYEAKPTSGYLDVLQIDLENVIARELGPKKKPGKGKTGIKGLDNLARSEKPSDDPTVPEFELEAQTGPLAEPETTEGGETQESLFPMTDVEKRQQEIENRKREMETAAERPSEAQEAGDLFATPQADIEDESLARGVPTAQQAKVEKWLEGPLKRLKGINVEVVPTVAHLNARYPNANYPADIAGVYSRSIEGGKIFIIAENLKSKRMAQEYLAHELVGHMGLERVLGLERFNELLNEVAHLKAESILSPGSHPEIEAAFETIKKNYIDEEGNYNLDLQQESMEILAHIAQTRPRIGPFRELYNKLLNWLRKILDKWGFRNVTRVKVGRKNETIEDLLEAAVRNVTGRPKARTETRAEEDAMSARTGEVGTKGSEAVAVRESGFTLPRPVVVKDVGKYFDKQFQVRYRRKGSASNPRDVARAKKRINEELNYQLSQAMTGKGWYDDDVHAAMEISAQFIPELLTDPATRQLMTVISGILSNGNKANQNWGYATDVMRGFMENGKIKTRTRNKMVFGRRGKNIALQLTGLQKALDSVGVEGVVEFMLGVHTGREIRAFKKEYWGTDRIEGRIQMGSSYFGARIFGPKIGPFTMAMNGFHADDVVMDVWATRTFRRHMGTMIDSDGNIIDAPSEIERAAFSKIVEEIAAENNLEVRDAQAIIWYFEQQLFAGLGARSNPESFSDGARTYAERNGGVQPSEATRAPGNAEDVSHARIGKENPGQSELFAEKTETSPAPKSRKGLGHKEASKRVPALRDSMKDMMDGKAAISEYDRMVNEHKPVDPYDYVPVPATPAEMRKALSSNKVDRIGAPARELLEGAPVGLRLDIPAYTNHGVWVVSVHGQTGGFDAGKVYGYDNVAQITNATFGSREKTAQKVAAGGPKSTMAVIKGEWVPTTQDDAHVSALAALTDDNWTQVGFDPERHSYFWDRHDMRPVVSADEVIQIGPLVMVKNPKYAPKDDFLYARTGRSPRRKKYGATYRIAQGLRGATDPSRDTFRRQKWSLISLRQIAEQIRPLIPSIRGEYLPLYQRMETVRNVWRSRAGEIAGRRRKLKNNLNDQLSKLQHESTIAGVDGDVPYEELITELDAAEQIKVINEQIRGRSGQDTSALMAKRKEIQKLLAQEKNRRKASQAIIDAFHELNELQREIYRDERQFHVDLREETRKALLDRINEAFVDEAVKGDMTAQLQILFESNEVTPPYFPLARFGEYWVYSEMDGEPFYDMFETSGEWKRHLQDTKDLGATILGRGKSQKDSKRKEEISPAFVGQIDKILSGLGDHPRINEIRDQIYQMYLESLPELSARKHAMHRSNMRGFYQDHLRSFASSAVHGANQLARIKYAHKMQGILDDAKVGLEMAQSPKKFNAMQEELDAYKDYLESDIGYMSDAQIRTEAMRLRKAAEREHALQMEFEPGEGSAALYARWLMYIKIKRQVDQRANSPVVHQRSALEALEERIARREGLLDMASNVNRQKDTEKTVETIDNVLAELQIAHNDIVNPNVASWANNFNALGFIMYLGLTPSAAIVNLMQTIVVSLPVGAARFGWGPMTKHMGQITAQINIQMRKSKGMPYIGIEKLLKNKGEEDAYKLWLEEGMLDKTLAHDLVGISEEGIYTGQTKHKVMHVAAFLFHQAERMNREVTALAVYRSAIDKGRPPASAARAAEDIVFKTHFDYSQGNRPRIMRGNAPRVLLQFKSFSQNISYLWFRTAQVAFGSQSKENPQARAEGKRMFFGMLAMQQLAAGALGLPLVGLAIMLAQLFNDDDEAEDYQGNIMQWAHDKFGTFWGEAVLKGVPNAAGVDMHSRLTLSDLWYRSSDRELQGASRMLEMIKAVGGPQASIGIDAWRSYEQMKESEDFWEYMRALETAAPKIFKDASKGVRYYNEGLKSYSGADVIPQEDVTAGMAALRILGFSPARISRAYDAKGAVDRVSTRRRYAKGLITKRYTALYEAWARAEQEHIEVPGLLGKMSDTLSMVEDWNLKNPDNFIDLLEYEAVITQNLEDSLTQKLGVQPDKNTRDLLEKYTFGDQ